MKTRIALVSAVLLLALTGCAGTVGDDAGEPQDAAPTTASETPTAEETVEPLSVTPTAEPETPEGKFLGRIRDGLADTELADATDEQLLATGEKACAQLADGVYYKDVLVVEGDVRTEDWYKYSSAFTLFGALHLCPELYPEDAPKLG